IHGEPMRHVEFTRLRTMVAPRRDEFSVGRSVDGRVVGLRAMAVGDEDVAVWRHQNIGGAVELVVTVAGNARLAERHQYAAVRAELDGGLAPAMPGAAIGDPDVAVAVDAKTMRPVDQTRPEARDQFAAGIEFLNRGDLRTFAGLRAAAVVDPHTGA